MSGFTPRLLPLVVVAAMTFGGGCSSSYVESPGEATRPMAGAAPRRARRTASRASAAPVVPGADPAPAAAPAPRAGPVPTAEDRRTFDEANRMRAEHGLRAFVWNDHLFRAAYDHSAEQARYGYMGHGSPDPARDDLADRLRFADCGALRAWAEVVAMGYEGPATVMDGWMNSRGHRKILLDPNLEEAAFARVGDYFTGDFQTSR